MDFYRKRSRERGFSVLEVMVAIVVFSFGILGLAKMQISAMHGNAVSKRMTTATQLASRQIEEIISMDYLASVLVDDDDDGASGLNDIDTPDESRLGLQVGSASEQYDLYWNVADDTPIPSTKTIRIIVTWLEGSNYRQVFMTLIKRLGD